MRALVTGGYGFIGSHLVDELLEQGCGARVLRRTTSDIIFLEAKKLSFVIGDFTNRKKYDKDELDSFNDFLRTECSRQNDCEA